jgi:iron complex outermembrane recepter protein
LLVAGVFGLPTPLLAQAVPTDDTFTLGTVEIIGRRDAQTLPQASDVVESSELTSKHRDDLAEALDLVPGVSVQNLGQRRERLIAVRGFSSRQVPLFIDGVPVYVPYDGNVDLARFGVDYVSKIVVSKGLTSLLYGPNILGGAVNVVSRKPTQPFEASVRLSSEADDHFDSNDQRASLTLGGQLGDWYGYATASHSESDGYRLPSDFVPVAAEDGGRRDNADSHDNVFTAKVGYAPDEDNEYALSYYKQNGEKRDPPYAGSYLRTNTRTDGVTPRFWTWPYWDKESIYFVARNAITSQGTLRWRVFHDRFRNALESYDDATYTTQTRPYAFHGSNYNDFTYGGSADFEWRWTGEQITRIAAHFRNDVHREAQITPFLPVMHLQIPTYDVALEHEWQVSQAFSLTPSYSHMIQPEKTVEVYNSGPQNFSPVHTDRSTADNLQLLGNFKLDESRSFIAGISRKTRFPTIKERFSGGLGTTVPNPSLDPETAVHFEVGFEQKGANWNGKVAVYQARLQDAIQSVPMPNNSCTVSPCTQLQNIGRQRNRGFELSGDYSPFDTLQLSAQYSLVDIKNLSQPSILPLNTPKNKLAAAVDWRFLSQWKLRVDAQYESKRYSTTNATRIANSYTLANAFVRFTPLDALGVEIGVRNIADKLYAYEEGYYEAGRSWLAQLDYRF